MTKKRSTRRKRKEYFLKKPKGCSGKPEHKAEVRIWIENDQLKHDRKVAPSIKCDVAEEDWERCWKDFRRRKGKPVCLCEDAAREVGVIW
jgi:hypothetical protein